MTLGNQGRSPQMWSPGEFRNGDAPPSGTYFDARKFAGTAAPPSAPVSGRRARETQKGFGEQAPFNGRASCGDRAERRGRVVQRIPREICP